MRMKLGMSTQRFPRVKELHIYHVSHHHLRQCLSPLELKELVLHIKVRQLKLGKYGSLQSAMVDVCCLFFYLWSSTGRTQVLMTHKLEWSFIVILYQLLKNWWKSKMYCQWVKGILRIFPTSGEAITILIFSLQQTSFTVPRENNWTILLYW